MRITRERQVKDAERFMCDLLSVWKSCQGLLNKRRQDSLLDFRLGMKHGKCYSNAEGDDHNDEIYPVGLASRRQIKNWKLLY